MARPAPGSADADLAREWGAADFERKIQLGANAICRAYPNSAKRHQVVVALERAGLLDDRDFIRALVRTGER